MTSYLFSLLMDTTHTLHRISLWSNHLHHSKSLILLPICFTSSLEPASYITQNSSSKLFIPLSATFIWTCHSNLVHTAITFHHIFTVSLWSQNLPFQKILSSTLICFCVRLISWLLTVYWISVICVCTYVYSTSEVSKTWKSITTLKNINIICKLLYRVRQN